MPDGGLPSVRTEVERRVLESMGRHRWWEPYGGRTPDPLPDSFGAASARLGAGTYSQPLYYGLAAALLRIAPAATVDGAYWRLRILSVALSMGTIILGWVGTSLLFGSIVATGATTMTILNPQFLLVAISVNPDAVLILLGSAMWWMAAGLITGRRPALSVVLIPVIAVAAVLTKRSAMPLAVIGGLIVLTALLRPVRWRITGRACAWIGVFVMIGAGILIAVWMAFNDAFSGLARYWLSGLLVRRPIDERMPFAALEYARLSVDYVWLVAGWLRFSAPEPWLWCARGLTVVGLAGSVVTLARASHLRRALSVAWLFLGIQCAVVVAWGFLTFASPQGRYLFPVVAPAAALLWVGISQAAPARAKPFLAPALVSIVAVLDLTAFTTVLIPAYLPWG
jgi:hypothetical protein